MSRIIFGSMTFSKNQVVHPSSDHMLDLYAKTAVAHQATGAVGGVGGHASAKCVEIDTAFMYNNGDSERMVGAWYHNQDPSTQALVSIATKVNPWETGGLTAADVRHQLDTSLDRLNLRSVDLLYLHGPSHTTPIEETLKALADQHSQGKFKEFGLSNFSAWQLVDIYHICRREGYPFVPSVYQGMYNGLTRSVEEIFEPCRKLGIRFYAYNPLAGGLLSGRYVAVDQTTEPTAGRFVVRSHYKDRFWNQPYFAAMNTVKAAMYTAADGADQPSMAGVALRWLRWHSKLSPDHGDGIIVGASSMDHLTTNLDQLSAGSNSANDKHQHGPLSEDLVKAFDAGWTTHIKGHCPAYRRGCV